jgi:hypothetical protein
MSLSLKDPPIGTVLVARLLLANGEGDVNAFSIWGEDLATLNEGIAAATKKLLAVGWAPMTKKQYRTFSEIQTRQLSTKLSAEVASNIQMGRAADPEALDRILKAHKGAEGGDA